MLLRPCSTGCPAGYAVDDGVGLLFGGTEPPLAVTARDDARAYRVTLVDGRCRREPIEPLRLEPDAPHPTAAAAPVAELRELRRRRRLRAVG